MLFSPVYIEAHPCRAAAHAANGYSVCKVVTPTTPTDPTDTLYAFSFQSLAKPYSPSCSNGTPFIPFISLSLRTISFATGGYTPLPPKKVQLVPSEAEGYPASSALPIFQDPEIRPGRSRSSLFTDHSLPAVAGVTEHDSRPLSEENDGFQ